MLIEQSSDPVDHPCILKALVTDEENFTTSQAAEQAGQSKDSAGARVNHSSLPVLKCASAGHLLFLLRVSDSEIQTPR